VAVVERSDRGVLRVAVAFVSLAGVVASLVVLNLAMRTLMGIGGACASGGPYVVATPCPKGVAWLSPVAIWAGLGFTASYTLAVRRLPGPKWTGLIWPALFISLGWQFVSFGVDDDAPNAGGVGLVITGAVFIVVGVAPLVYVFASPVLRRWTMWGDAIDLAARRPARPQRPAASTGMSRLVGAPPHLGHATPAGEQRAPSRSRKDPSRARRAVDDLEQLAQLRRSGDLDTDEYERLKAHVLAELDGGPP
jgi:hypothetical protein